MAPQKKARFAPPHPFPFPPVVRRSPKQPSSQRPFLSQFAIVVNGIPPFFIAFIGGGGDIISRSVARRVSSCATGRVTPEIGLGWCQGWRRVAGCRQNPRDMRVNFINKIFWISHIGSFIVRGGRQSFINLICLELLLNIK